MTETIAEKLSDGGVTTTLLASHDTAHAKKPRDLIEFDGPNQWWKLNRDVDVHGDHDPDKKSDTTSAGELAGGADGPADGYDFPDHFEVDKSSGTAVRFLAHLYGARTDYHNGDPEKGYPRTELREMTGSHSHDEAAWTIAENDHTAHRLTAEVAVTKAPRTQGHQRVVIGQIHDEKSDVVEILYDAEEKAIVYRWLGVQKNDDPLIKPYVPRTWFVYHIEAVDGKIRISVDAGPGFPAKAVEDDASAEKCYFKAGAYVQSNSRQHNAEADDYGEALFRRIVVETGGH